MAYRDIVLADSPVDYYEMNTATGTDSGSGSRTLTLSGGITTGATGKAGSAWSFDGVDDVATMASFPSLTTAYTMEAWIKAPSPQGFSTDYPTIIRRDGTDIVLLRVRGSNLPLSPGEAEVYIAGTVLQSGSSYRVDDGNWHHIVYTQSGASARLYVDGVQRASGTVAKSTFNFGTGTAYVGGGNTAASAPTELFKGTMDEVSIYNTALSAARISTHYGSAGSGPWTRAYRPTVDGHWASGAWQNNDSTLFVSTLGGQVRLQIPKATLVPAGEMLTSAKLRLTVSNISGAGSTTLEVAGHPSITKVFTSASTPDETQQEFDITPLVAATSGDTVTVTLSRTSGSGALSFHSMEASYEDDRPYFLSTTKEYSVSTAVDVLTPNVSAAVYDYAYAGPEQSVTTDLMTATVSLESYEAEVETQEVTVVELAPYEDFSVAPNGTIYEEDSNSIHVVASAGVSDRRKGIFKFELPGDLTDAGFISAEIGLQSEIRGGSVQEYLDIITSLDGNPYEYPSVDGPAITIGFDKTFTDLGESFTLDNFHGFSIGAAGGGNVLLSSSESAEAGVTLRLSYVSVPADVLVEVPTSTLTVNAHEAEASGFSITDVETVSVLVDVNEALIETTTSPNVIQDVEMAGMSLKASDAEVSINVSTSLSEVESIYLDATDASVEINNSVFVDLDTPKVLTGIYRVTSVNGTPVLPREEDDPYFISTMETMSGGSTRWINTALEPREIQPYENYWFRFNETSGVIAYDRLPYPNPYDPTQPLPEANNGDSRIHMSGVGVGRYDGPEGRHSFHFDGNAHMAHEGRFGFHDQSLEAGLEFTFRTEKKTQFLMGNYSATTGYQNGGGRNPSVWELWLKDGFFEIRIFGGPVGNKTYTAATTDVADGKWHHIVLQTSAFARHREAEGINYWGLELWVDAHLELRRKDYAQGVTGIPDYIGGRVENYLFAAQVERFQGVRPLARENFFEGDMTEFMFRHYRMLTFDEVARQRDAMFAIEPVRVASARTEFKSDVATAKGNKPRILVLDFGFNMPGYVYNVGNRNWRNNQRDTISMAVNFAAEPEMHSFLESADRSDGTMTTPGGLGMMAFVGLGDAVVHYPEFEQGEFLFFRHPVGMYRDPVTDNDVLIDLEKDLIMDDYDIISIIGYPGNEAQFYASYGRYDVGNMPPKKMMVNELERVLGQIKDQVIDHGKGLFISDPFSAIALGMIDQVDMVPQAKEASRRYWDPRPMAVNPGMDGHSLAIDPFGGGAPRVKIGPDGIYRTAWEDYRFGPDTMEKMSARYRDNHAISYQKVRALVPGLTDIGSWARVDEITWYNVNPENEPPYVYSRKYENKMDGLSIGDEFYVDHHPGDETVRSFDSLYDKLAWKDLGFYVAAPSSAVKVGTVVTTFNDYIYVGVEEARKAFTSEYEEEVIANPYRDHAISVVVEPGDVWDGRQVSGKVFMNFTEALQPRAAAPKNEPILMWKHLFPDAPDHLTIEPGEKIFVGNGELVITPEMADWHYTTGLDTWVGSQVLLSPGGKGDWGWSSGGTRGSGLSGGGAGGAYAMSWGSSPPTQLAYIPVINFSNRALIWMAKDIDRDGQANVNVKTAQVSAKAEKVSAEGSIVTEVELSTARAIVDSHNDLDTADSDTTVLVSTATTVVKAGGVNSEFVAQTAGIGLAAPILSLAESDIVDWTEAIVLKLPRQITTLTLEEN